MTYKKVAKVAEKFHCISCDYFTFKKCDYEKHLQTQKHKNNTILINDTQKSAALKMYCCECGKSYKHNQSLFNHKKKCEFIIEQKEDSSLIQTNNKNEETSLPITQETIVKLITENNDIKNLLVNQQQQLLEQQKQIGIQQKQLGDMVPKMGNNITNNNTANIKQKFNINIFLNEQCKDAINMNDFIKQIQLTLDNLDFTKNNGLTEGLSNIFIENMNKLSLYERPLHCTDNKRETLYIKDNDSWEKDKNKNKIKEAIKSLNKNHFKLVKEWLQENPDFNEIDEKQDYFARVLKECGNEVDNEKLVKKICTTTSLKDDLKYLDESLVE
jgi:flagellar motility protein MotE (MotC chaperone)